MNHTLAPTGIWRDLLDGWFGPVLITIGDRDGDVLGCVLPGYRDLVVGALGDLWERSPDSIRLPLSRRECRLLVCDVAARGLRCTICRGRRVAGVGPIEPDYVTIGPCEACNGTGYLRRPHSLTHLLDAPLGTLPPDLAGHSAELLSVSAARISVGLGAIVGVRQPPTPTVLHDGIVLLNGYRFPDTGAALAEIDKCNADALRRGYAYLERGALVTP